MYSENEIEKKNITHNSSGFLTLSASPTLRRFPPKAYKNVSVKPTVNTHSPEEQPDSALLPRDTQEFCLAS